MKISKNILIAFVLATLLGACLHALYRVFPSPVAALFSATRESVWEHVKIMFWPYLAASVYFIRKEGNAGGWLLSLLAVCAAMLGACWLWNIVLGKAADTLDLVFYVILMAIGFLLPPALGRWLKGRWTEAVALLTVVLGVCVILFTFLPPDGLIFADLSGVRSWMVIPY